LVYQAVSSLQTFQLEVYTNYIFFPNSMAQIENIHYIRTDGPIDCYKKDNNRYTKEYKDVELR
jgi:hypothetical protein